MNIQSLQVRKNTLVDSGLRDYGWAEEPERLVLTNE